VTHGISPKVKLPAAMLLAVGLGLLIASVVLDDADKLVEVGLSLIGASGLAGGLGYVAPPGEVAVEPGVPSDELLPSEALALMDADFSGGNGFDGDGEPDEPTPEDESEELFSVHE
jgi:hypothetical protein